MVKNVYCISLTLAARLIGIIGVISGFVVVVHVSGELLEPQHLWLGQLIGFEMEDISHTRDEPRTAEMLMLLRFYLLFAVLYTASSGSLIWASYTKALWLATPWLVCEAFSVIAQVAAIIVKEKMADAPLDSGVLVISLVLTVISVYFWIVVFLTMTHWRRGSSSSLDFKDLPPVEDLSDEVFAGGSA